MELIPQEKEWDALLVLIISIHWQKRLYSVWTVQKVKQEILKVMGVFHVLQVLISIQMVLDVSNVTMVQFQLSQGQLNAHHVQLVKVQTVLEQNVKIVLLVWWVKKKEMDVISVVQLEILLLKKVNLNVKNVVLQSFLITPNGIIMMKQVILFKAHQQ